MSIINHKKYQAKNLHFHPVPHSLIEGNVALHEVPQGSLYALCMSLFMFLSLSLCISLSLYALKHIGSINQPW